MLALKFNWFWSIALVFVVHGKWVIYLLDFESCLPDEINVSCSCFWSLVLSIHIVISSPFSFLSFRLSMSNIIMSSPHCYVIHIVNQTLFNFQCGCDVDRGVEFVPSKSLSSSRQSSNFFTFSSCSSFLFFVLTFCNLASASQI